MKLLVVEDDEAIRECLVDLLAEEYQVEGAKNGAEALKLIESGHRYDLMLLDLFMPVMDGPTLLQRLSKAGRAIPTVILTAGRVPPALSKYPALIKPFDIDVLFRTISGFQGVGSASL